MIDCVIIGRRKRWADKMRQPHNIAFGSLHVKREGEDCRCALGVGVQVFEEENPGVLKVECDSAGRFSYDENCAILPKRVAEYFACTDVGDFKIGIMFNRMRMGSVCGASDNEVPAEVIADHIEGDLL